MKLTAAVFLALVATFSRHQNAHAQGSAGKKVLIMGDSYASGNGARDKIINGVPNYAGIQGCYRSPTSFGSIFARRTNSTLVANRACSNGVLADIRNARTFEPTVPVAANGQCPPSPFAPEEYLVNISSTTCSRRVAPQIDGVTPDLDLILFAAGGNDLIFASIVEKCLFYGARSESGCRDFMATVRRNLNSVTKTVTDTLVAMANLTKADAKIVVVGYPHIVKDTPYVYEWSFLFFYETLEITNNLRSLGNDIEAAYEKAVMDANKAVGRNFTDFFPTKALFAGHEPHPDPLQFNADRWIWETETRTDGADAYFIRPENYHLNPKGHVMLGEALAQKYFGLVPTPAPVPVPPTKMPTRAPTKQPTKAPTRAPIKPPTKAPTRAPVTTPVLRPPSRAPVVLPTRAPIDDSDDDDDDQACRGPFRCLFRLLFGWLF